MMIIMNMFNRLMRLYLFNNHDDLQPQVTVYPKPMHLHQLQHFLVFKINHHILTFIWYPLIWRWNNFTYSTGWSNFVVLIEDHLINQFLSHIQNLLNPKQHPQLFDRELFIHKAPNQARLVVGPGERSQVPHHRPVLRGNQGVGIVTCSYCYQKGHMFSRCPFVDDKLRQFLKVEVMNVHQPILPTIIIVIPNVFILGTQAMNPSIVHIMVPINY